ncbi:hypothetical protein C1645_835876 [Glomus cerebriforme]|uniref:Uncharacterized protein n=1 Tax=Glomus cerebriforme TaxID=658196 RepID=A0A397SBA3_9GLOM|nr:hypothetical protein C1645_835876 [Glomus cerebriforme]
MEGSSSQQQSGNSFSKKPNTSDNLEINNTVAYKTVSHRSISNNLILLELEEDGFFEPDEKAKKLIAELSEINCLYALKLLFENPANRFSPKVLRDSLVALVDPTPFDYYEIQSVTRLELHLRTWAAVLEKICFTQMRLSKELRDKVYNSLSKFVEIHRKTTQVMQEGIDNKYVSNQFNQFQDNKEYEDIIKKRNYNIDFLLIHLRDTLHSLRDDETWLYEITRRTKDLLKAALNITPGILSIMGSILDSQSKFDEISNKVAKTLRNTGSFLNELAGNEPLAFPHTLCSFIQFKAIEILLHLHNIDNQMFSMIETDFDQYIQKLNENNSTTDSSEKFPDEMTCPISIEPIDQLCIFKCQHILSLNSFKKLKQKICPQCKEKIEDNDIRYLSQNSIYKNLYPKFFEAGHILPSIELDDSNQIIDNQYDSDSDNSEVDQILTKKKKIMNIIKSNSNILLSSIIPKISKKQHPIYQNVLKELNEKNYTKSEYWCKKFLDTFPKSYSIRCILAYTYRCLNNYKKAHLYLNEAIEVKEKKPIAYFIRGEIFFRQGEYKKAINDLNKSLGYKAEINNLYIIIGNSCLLQAKYFNAQNYYDIALKKDPNNYLCLKNHAYIYGKQENYQKTLDMLDKLLNINEDDSLILCYYGEILSIKGKYYNAIEYFTKANNIDPENIHILIKRAIAYYILQEYDKALSDLDKVIQLDPLNSLAYYHKSLTYHTKQDVDNTSIAYNKFTELVSDDILAKIQLYHLEYLLNNNSSEDLSHILAKINQISNIKNASLLLIRCKIYIELKKYNEAQLDFDMLFNYWNDYDISYIYYLREYSDFWSYLCEVYEVNYGFTELGIVNEFNKYMYFGKKIYFISNLINLNNELCHFQESDANSLSGQVLCSKNEEFRLDVPGPSRLYYDIIWKINIKKILSRTCFIKFIVKFSNYQDEHILKYEDVSKLKGLGWIEYQFPSFCNKDIGYVLAGLSIEVKGSIDMQIDYVRYGYGTRKCNPNMSYLLPHYHEFYPNIPETFKNKYFSKKEMENLLELKDIINNL